MQKAWKVVDLERPQDWDEALGRLPDHDIFHTWGWHAAFEGIDERRSFAYIWRDRRGILFHPFHLRPIEGGGTDIETVYGYSGPLSSNDDPQFLKDAWSPYTRWCADQGVVSEFFRFNPLLGNQVWAPPGMSVTLDRQTVVVDLSQGPEALWSGYEQTQRSRVRKAERGGLVVEDRPLAVDPTALGAFYRAAMAEIGAAKSYFFPDEHFVRLGELFGENAREFRVTQGSSLMATALFLRESGRLHYHLAATPRATRAACPTNLLLHRAALWGMEHDCRILHLGGGRTAAPSDDLLAFKRQFSRSRTEFIFGTRILDTDRYRALCQAWLGRHGGPRPAHFQLYRLPIAGG